jgi:hypothetical protein
LTSPKVVMGHPEECRGQSHFTHVIIGGHCHDGNQSWDADQEQKAGKSFGKKHGWQNDLFGKISKSHGVWVFVLVWNKANSSRDVRSLEILPSNQWSERKRKASGTWN